MHLSILLCLIYGVYSLILISFPANMVFEVHLKRVHRKRMCLLEGFWIWSFSLPRSL